jgi:hypothetical protein
MVFGYSYISERGSSKAPSHPAKFGLMWFLRIILKCYFGRLTPSNSKRAHGRFLQENKISGAHHYVVRRNVVKLR